MTDSDALADRLLQEALKSLEVVADRYCSSIRCQAANASTTHGHGRIEQVVAAISALAEALREKERDIERRAEAYHKLMQNAVRLEQERDAARRERDEALDRFENIGDNLLRF